MESNVLKIIKEELSSLNLNYEYGEYTKELKYPYGVGEYSENNYTFEDNVTNGEFIVTFFNRGSELDLINIKELIKDKFKDFRKATDSGTIYIAYTHKLFIRSGEAELKKMEIYLDVRYVKGE